MVTNDDRCTLQGVLTTNKLVEVCKVLDTLYYLKLGDLPRKNCSLLDCDLHFFLAYEPLKILKGSKDAGKCMSCFLV